MNSNEKIAEIKKRLNLATPGPWTVSEDGQDVTSSHAKSSDYIGPNNKVCTLEDNEYINNENLVNDGAFIAASRSDIEFLLNEIDRLSGVDNQEIEGDPPPLIEGRTQTFQQRKVYYDKKKNEGKD